MKEHLPFHSCQRSVSDGPPRKRCNPLRYGPVLREPAEILLLTRHCFLQLPRADSRKSAFLFLFISEDGVILARIVAGDAENTSIVIIIRVKNSVVAISEVMFFINVDLIDIGIIRDDDSVDT